MNDQIFRRPGPIDIALNSCDHAVANIGDARSAVGVRLTAAKNHVEQVKETMVNLVTALRDLASLYDKEAKVVGSHYSRSTVLSEVAEDIRAALRGEENDSGPTVYQEAARLARPKSDIIARIDKYLEGATSEYQDQSDGCDLLAEARTALMELDGNGKTSGPSNEDDGSAVLTVELSQPQTIRLLKGATLEGDLTTDVGPATLKAMASLANTGEPMIYQVRVAGLASHMLGALERDAVADRYVDSDGRKCTLDTMVKREPEWAANRLRVELAKKEQLLKKIQRLHRMHGHALHAITAAQNGLSNLEDGKFPLTDIPIMIGRVRELEQLALGKDSTSSE